MAAVLKGHSKPKCSKLDTSKRPFRMNDFEGYNWWTLRAPMILCADLFHDDGASVWAREMMAQNRRRAFQKTVAWSPTPFKALTPEGKPIEGIKA